MRKLFASLFVLGTLFLAAPSQAEAQTTFYFGVGRGGTYVGGSFHGGSRYSGYSHRYYHGGSSYNHYRTYPRYGGHYYGGPYYGGGWQYPSRQYYTVPPRWYGPTTDPRYLDQFRPGVYPPGTYGSPNSYLYQRDMNRPPYNYGNYGYGTWNGPTPPRGPYARPIYPTPYFGR